MREHWRRWGKEKSLRINWKRLLDALCVYRWIEACLVKNYDADSVHQSALSRGSSPTYFPFGVSASEICHMTKSLITILAASTFFLQLQKYHAALKTVPHDIHYDQDSDWVSLRSSLGDKSSFGVFPKLWGLKYGVFPKQAGESQLVFSLGYP
jgi:hypothetical protein